MSNATATATTLEAAEDLLIRIRQALAALPPMTAEQAAKAAFGPWLKESGDWVEATRLDPENGDDGFVVTSGGRQGDRPCLRTCVVLSDGHITWPSNEAEARRLRQLPTLWEGRETDRWSITY